MISGNSYGLCEKMKEKKRTLEAIAREVVKVHLWHWYSYAAVKPAFPGSILLL